jgi:hypothetical protein
MSGIPAFYVVSGTAGGSLTLDCCNPAVPKRKISLRMPSDPSAFRKRKRNGKFTNKKNSKRVPKR